MSKALKRSMNTTELKRLAEAATPGPWKSQLSSVKKGARNIAPHIHAGESLPIGEDVKRGNANAAYIAAANPAAILELLAINAELVEALKTMLSEFNEQTVQGMVHNEFMACVKARDALAKAEGGEL